MNLPGTQSAITAATGFARPGGTLHLPWAAAAAVLLYALVSWLLNGYGVRAAPLIETTLVGAAAVVLLYRFHRKPFRNWPVAELAVTSALGLALVLVLGNLALARTAADPAWSQGFMVLHLVILVPLAEELFFRGALQGEIQRAWGYVPGILLTTVVFLLLHAPSGLTAILQLAVLSLACCGVRLLRHGLLAAVLLHIVWNLTAVTLQTNPQALAQPWMLPGGGLILAAILVGFALPSLDHHGENS